MATLEKEKEKQQATRAFNGELHGHFANSKAVSRGIGDDDDEEEEEEEPARCLLLGESSRRKVVPVHIISQPELPPLLSHPQANSAPPPVPGTV